MPYNEDSRVKIPALIHLTRMGYEYLSLKNTTWDKDTNIFTSHFTEVFIRLNEGLTELDAERELKELSSLLDNDDLGKSAYERLTDTSKARLIDLNNFTNNNLHVVTELTCANGDDNFRPDITLLINGMPLVFIEVKVPNNRDGILAERERMNVRFQNSKFRKFINLTQLMVFSNNMEYDDDDPEPLQGAYYASTSTHKAVFNYFREERPEELKHVHQPIIEATEDFILADNNLQAIKHTGEFLSNKNPDSPTNRILTSLFSPDRLAFILKYAIAYVEDKENFTYQKHVMRYPQIFASKAITDTLENGDKGGIIWHTQGSGKTALAYYNVKYLRDYYTAKGIVPKFYFIVDRLDLLRQAGNEFKKRGLRVHAINSKEEFAQDIKSTIAIHNDTGDDEITVVNIQRFENDPDVARNTDYAVNIQRIYFLDEVHRSYNPEGSFLSNLQESDPNAVHIGLTGTPLLSRKIKAAGAGKPAQKYDSKALFGSYIHKYYYDSSIKDGYTLRLIREEISTEYKARLREILDEIETLKGGGKAKVVLAHAKFVIPMLDYIIKDLDAERVRRNDDSIGGMVICDSAEQAKEMAKWFSESYGEVLESGQESQLLVAENEDEYNVVTLNRKTVKTAALILHDIGSKDDRDHWVDLYKKGRVDILFVYNMLLTGFDAPRLKKLYLGRVIREHNLLQALTRVNRTYKDYRYGYVVDFADISKEFKKANEAYFKELQAELGDELVHYDNLFKSEEEIEADIELIKDTLWKFDTENRETFCQQVSEMTDREEVRELVKAFTLAKSLYNLIRQSGKHELLYKVDFRQLHSLSNEAQKHLELLNKKEAIEQSNDSSQILNVALEDVFFAFRKIDEHEMKIADQLRNSIKRTREILGGNFDPKDPEFISLREELERIFKKRNISEVSIDEMGTNIDELDGIYNRAKELERKNKLIKEKYNQDVKYARIHKRLLEKKNPTERERKLFEALTDLKKRTDELVTANAQLLSNESFAEKEFTRAVIQEVKKHDLPLDRESAEWIRKLVLREYLAEFTGMKFGS